MIMDIFKRKILISYIHFIELHSKIIKKKIFQLVISTNNLPVIHVEPRLNAFVSIQLELLDH